MEKTTAGNLRWFFLWRSRRDSNSRAAFDGHTISSRARYDHFDTTPDRRRPGRFKLPAGNTPHKRRVLLYQFFPSRQEEFYKKSEKSSKSSLSGPKWCRPSLDVAEGGREEAHAARRREKRVTTFCGLKRRNHEKSSENLFLEKENFLELQGIAGARQKFLLTF